MNTRIIVNKGDLNNHSETALKVKLQVARGTHRFVLPFLMLAVLFVTGHAFHSTLEGTSFPTRSRPVEAGERAPVETAPSSCMWVDIKGPNGVWYLTCYVPPSGE